MHVNNARRGSEESLALVRDTSRSQVWSQELSPRCRNPLPTTIPRLHLLGIANADRLLLQILSPTIMGRLFPVLSNASGLLLLQVLPINMPQSRLISVLQNLEVSPTFFSPSKVKPALGLLTQLFRLLQLKTSTLSNFMTP